MNTLASPPAPHHRGPQRLALFDLDHTLLPLDSDHAFGDYMIRLGWVDAAEHRRRNDDFYADYQRGGLDLAAYVDFATAPWRDRSADELARVREGFMREVITPALRPEALALLRQHREAGDLMAIVTATNRFVTEPIAQALGVEHLLAVDLVRDAHGRYTGAIAGTPSYREGKPQRVREWLAGLGLGAREWAQSIAYGDSLNDLPLLESVSDPVATNPAPALRQIAAARGWRILQLFS